MNKTSKIMTAFIAGAAAGTLAAILLAPDKGSETRKKLATKLKEKYNDYKEKYDGMKEKVGEVL